MRGGEFKKAIREAMREFESTDILEYKSKIVRSEEDILKYLNMGFSCEKIAVRWLMRRRRSVKSEV